MPGAELFGEEERKEVNDVMSTGILFRYNHDEPRKGIWKAREFETEVKKVTGAQYAHAVSSGSTAIATALASAGIGAGDEVIVPPFTYIATIEAVLFLGAIPVFAEIEETLCLSAEGISKAITPRTKAVCLVHMCGSMADMDPIMELTQKHKLLLVEDAGQAMGASYKGTSVGLFGVSGAYSFDFFKIATAGEGGVIVTNSEKIYKHADSYSDHGHDHVGTNRGLEGHPILGFNYRISEIHAAIGLAQTRKLPFIRSKNREHKKILSEIIEGTEGVQLARIPDPEGDSATFFNILLPDLSTTQRTIDELNKAGITGFQSWFFNNKYHFINQWEHLSRLNRASKLTIELVGVSLNYGEKDLPRSYDIIGRLLSFGIRCTWTEEQVRTLGKNIKNCIQKASIKEHA